jgi:hypothetical protein
MGHIKEHAPVKLILGITYNPDVDIAPIFTLLEDLFSSIELKSNVYQFSKFTKYYEPEMGKNLNKLFVVFAKLIEIEMFAEIKVTTNQIESDFSESDQRKINLDPGYISEAKLVLATTKNYTHRIYLQRGIFGDVHLNFQDNSFQIQSWTYPDYQQKEVIEFFNNVRQRYLHQLGDRFEADINMTS